MVADNAAFELGANNFTVENWVYFAGYPSSNAGAYNSTIACQDVTGSRGWVFLVSGTASSLDSLGFAGFPNSDNSGVLLALQSYSFSLNTSYHVAAVRLGNLLYLFVNGTLLNSGGDAFNITIFNTTSPLKIGASEFDGTYKYALNGYIDDFRLTKGVARYTSSFAVPTAAFPDS